MIGTMFRVSLLLPIVAVPVPGADLQDLGRGVLRAPARPVALVYSAAPQSASTTISGAASARPVSIAAGGMAITLATEPQP